MKLYTIQIRHVAPKDSEDAIVTYALANNEESIYDYIDKELCFGIWTDRDNDSIESPLEIHNEDGEIVGSEFYKEKMLRIRGEFNDEHADYSDAYYGITHYGWTEGKEITEDEAELLLKLGIAIDLRNGREIV